MLGIKMAFLMPEGGQITGEALGITLMQWPDSANQDPVEMQRQMREQLAKQGHGGEMEAELEPQTFTVRGKEIVAAVQEA